MDHEPILTIKKFSKMVLIVLGIITISIAILLLVFWLIFTVGLNSLTRSCQNRAGSIMKENIATINSFKTINFAGTATHASIGSPLVASGDCVDSQPSMSLQENYVINVPMSQAITTFADAAKTAGYQAEYNDEPPACNTDSSDASINAYENTVNRAAIDEAEKNGGSYTGTYIQIIPQFTCDTTGMTATGLTVTLSIED